LSVKLQLCQYRLTHNSLHKSGLIFYHLSQGEVIAQKIGTRHFKVVVFWVVTPCRDMVGHQSFGGPCCLHIQGEGIPKSWYPSKSLYGVKFQKTSIWIFYNRGNVKPRIITLTAIFH
jgi:hypothetical protein